MLERIQKILKPKTRNARHELGRWGERVAARELRKKGHRILGRRFRIGRRDEFDLITRDGQALVFVEVKTRSSEDFARPFDAINRAKREALSRAAVHYLKRLRQRPEYFRFDVVEVVGTQKGPPPVVRHIENAFNMDPRYRV